MPAYADSTRFSRNTDCSWSSLGDEVLILDMAKRKSHRLVGAAAHVWQGALDGLTRKQLVERLCARFEVAADRAGHDVDDTLTALTNLGVLLVATE